MGLNYVNKVEHRFWVFVLAVIPDSIRDPEHLKLKRSCPADGGIASLVRNDDLFPG